MVELKSLLDMKKTIEKAISESITTPTPPTITTPTPRPLKEATK